MAKDTPHMDWEKIINKFSLYNGTIVGFCKENKITTHQFQYHRKKL